MTLRPTLPLQTASFVLALAFICTTLAGCSGDAEMAEAEPRHTASADLPEITTRADSIALAAYEAVGGPDAWASLPLLQFNFGHERDGETRIGRKHLWQRHTGDYRLEWKQGTDSTYVVLFNTDTREGMAYLNGSEVDSTQRQALLDRAYRSYINDSYWLLMPTKLLDPGVTRSYEPDSSDANTDVVRLSFEGVGLTPGDQYWVYVDAESGRVKQWRYVLQGGHSGASVWTDYEQLQAPAGPVYVSTRKPSLSGDSALLTDGVSAPSDVPADLFDDPAPRLF